MPGLHCVYSLWWLFVYLQIHRAKRMLREEPQSVPWIFDPAGWIVYEIISVIWGERKAKEYAETRKRVIRKYCDKFATLYTFLALTAMVLSLLQCFLSILTA